MSASKRKITGKVLPLPSRRSADLDAVRARVEAIYYDPDRTKWAALTAIVRRSEAELKARRSQRRDMSGGAR